MGFLLKASDFGMRYALRPPYDALRSAQFTAWPTDGQAPGLVASVRSDGWPGFTPDYGDGGIGQVGGPLGQLARQFGAAPWDLAGRLAATPFAQLVAAPAATVAAAARQTFGWEYYAAADTVTGNSGLASNLTAVTFASPGAGAWITATTASGTETFTSLAALATRAGVALATVLAWVGTAPGVSWRVSTG